MSSSNPKGFKTFVRLSVYVIILLLLIAFILPKTASIESASTLVVDDTPLTYTSSKDFQHIKDSLTETDISRLDANTFDRDLVTNDQAMERATLQNTIVKHTASGYRYFFLVENQGKAPLEGNILISLYNQDKSFHTGREYVIENSIENQMGRYFSFEFSTSPSHVDPVYGFRYFEYQIVQPGFKPISGLNTISSKLE